MTIGAVERTSAEPSVSRLPRLRLAAAHGARRDAVGSFLLQIASIGLGFVSNVIVARLVGISGYGYYSIALGWSALLTSPSVLGLDRVLVRELAWYRKAERLGLVRGLLRRANQVALCGALVLGLGTLLIAVPMSRPGGRTAVVVGLLVLMPVSAVSRVRLSALQGLKRATLALFTQSTVRAVSLILILSAIAILTTEDHTISASEAVAAQVAAVIVAIGVGSFALRRVLPSDARRTPIEYDHRRWTAGIKVLAALGVVVMLNTQMGILMLGWLGTAADAGRFAAATRVAALVVLGYAATNAVLAPRIVERHRAGDRDGLERLLTHGSLAALAAGLPATVGVAIFAPDVLGAFGDGFGGGRAALLILVAGQLVNAATGSVSTALLMTGHERVVTATAVAAAALNLALCATLIPRFGAEGAAIGMTVSLVAMNVAYTILVARRLGVVTFRNAFARRR